MSSVIVLLKRCTAHWNLFLLYNKETNYGKKSLFTVKMFILVQFSARKSSVFWPASASALQKFCRLKHSY